MPYTAFASVTDSDLQALYAFLMTQPAVSAAHAPNTPQFPFNLRPLLAAWNTLFLRPGVFQPDPAQSEAWNRGAYLVDGLGHCGACHSPRTALGAERRGAYLAGGVADGWRAQALNGGSPAPLPWTEDDYFDYLRTGGSRFHGVAAGPMGPVVQQLAAVPDTDIRAKAIYLASLAPAASEPQAALAAAIEARTAPGLADSLGARLYDGACAVCHTPGRGPALFGARPSLALNSNVHGETPDTLVRVILDGIAAPANANLGAMPGFGGSLTNEQLAALANYIRAQFAPGRPAWLQVEQTIARLRGS